MNARLLSPGKVVYDSAGRRGVVTAVKKYRFGLYASVAVRWADGTETSGAARPLRAEPPKRKRSAA